MIHVFTGRNLFIDYIKIVKVHVIIAWYSKDQSKRRKMTLYSLK